MDLTTHILTKNNEATIEKALISLSPIKNNHIVVADLGSHDSTISICEKYGLEIMKFPHMNRGEIRNRIISKRNGWQMYLEPWEILTMGHQELSKASQGSYYVTVVQNGTLNKEIRLWNGNYKFANPIFEHLKTKTNQELNIIIYSNGGLNYVDAMKGIEAWKESEPISLEPFYYQACMLLMESKYEEFLKISEHYMFLNKESNMSATMNHYYYALVQTLIKKKAKPAIQNLTICLCANPLMAEFWCLLGDIHYHLLNDFAKAKTLYQNAIILGSNRLKKDKWPMEIAKYKSYPTKMIKSCNEILESSQYYH